MTCEGNCAGGSRETVQEAPGPVSIEFSYSFHNDMWGEAAQEAPAPFSIEPTTDFIRKDDGNCT